MEKKGNFKQKIFAVKTTTGQEERSRALGLKIEMTKFYQS